MISKFSVLNPASVVPKLVRTFGCTYLEKCERLRQLCCTSDMSRRYEEQESACAPRLPAPLTPAEAKSICELYHVHQGIELMDVRCKTALIMGGASTIGYETAATLIENGALHVIIADHDRVKAECVVDKLNAPLCEKRAACLIADVRSNTSYDQAFKEVNRCHRQIDIFVNCVKVYNETPGCWENMLNVNLIGTIRGTILAYRYLSQNGQGGCLPKGGVILNLSSLSSLDKEPTMPFYAAAAAGIRGLTSSFGHEFHYEKTLIRCLTLCTDAPPLNSPGDLMKLRYDPKWAGSSGVCKKPVSTKLIGRSIVHMIKHASNGSVFVTKDDKLYKYFIPNYKHVMCEEAVLH